MYEKIQGDYGQTPGKYLVDGGFTHRDDVTNWKRRAPKFTLPCIRNRSNWSRARIPTPANLETPRKWPRSEFGWAPRKPKTFTGDGRRSPSFPNADCRNRGLTQFRVRGLVKAKAQALWHVLAFNFSRMLKLNYLEVVMAS